MIEYLFGTRIHQFALLNCRANDVRVFTSRRFFASSGRRAAKGSCSVTEVGVVGLNKIARRSRHEKLMVPGRKTAVKADVSRS
jgi:hypothetical protein